MSLLTVFSKPLRFTALSLVIAAVLSACANTVTPKRIETKRYALVIGNAHYQVVPLKNPMNDARDISNALKDLHFEVSTYYDLDKASMRRVIGEFYTLPDLAGSEVVFYYAGHAVQYNGKNYLVPVNISLDDNITLEDVTFDLDILLDRMKAANVDLNIVILDACRNNPFSEQTLAKAGRSLPRSMRGLKPSKGLAKVKAPSSTLIAFATSPDDVALDGSGSNGTYTKHLLKHLATPGITISQMFERVRAGVIDETQHKQVPWEHSSLYKSDFYFVPPDSGEKHIITW